MELLRELFDIITETSKKKKKKKPVVKSAAAAVYHRDYERTKHKPYRAYDPEERRHQHNDSE